MNARIEEMLRDAERAMERGHPCDINRHLLGMISVLVEEIDAIRGGTPAPNMAERRKNYPLMIDAARAVALADAVREFLYGTGIGSQNQVSRASLESALAKFESSK